MTDLGNGKYISPYNVGRANKTFAIGDKLRQNMICQGLVYKYS
jgi:hypothetical protein